MSEQPQRLQFENGETAAPSARVAVSLAMREALLDPESWRESLEAYADATNLAVALVDVTGRLLGPCLNPRPTWSRLHAHPEAANTRCPFALAPRRPCTCVTDALAQRTLVLVRDRTGLVHFTVPLLLDDQPMGALLAGQVFDQYPEQLVLERIATRVGLSPQAVWQVARLEVPVKRATLRVYGRLLDTLGQAFLHARYHTLLDALRLDSLEQHIQERTAALHQALAERQCLEQEAQRAEHFALLGRLAAGVSHEIRNPLAAIFLHVDILEEELRQPHSDSPAAVAETLAEIRLQLGRLEDLVQNYLSLVRVGGNIEPTPEDLGAALAAWATEAQEQAAARGVTIHLEGLADLGLVGFHAATLRRAVLNLVQNALDAMPRGGRLTLAGHGTATQVQVHVQDTGSGMPAAVLERIFEPLYTTKPGGTGLGLYIVREIVAAHGGQLTVQSTEGQGTTFTITLPRVASAPSVPHAAEAAQTGQISGHQQ
jgi:signal transduction histidine kinase